MQIKKSPKANLENYSKLFMQLGLVLALLVVYLAIEKKTYDRVIGNLGPVVLNMEDEEQTIEIEQIKPPEPKTPPPPTPDKIEIVEDEEEVEETVIESTETDEDEAVEVEEIIEVEEEEEVMEDVPFAIIEDVPVYPGCKGSKAELRACLQEKITKHVNRKFNADLASDLGLAPGVKRIFVMFKIDKRGNIVDVMARAPHKRLQEEAIRVVNLLPKMTPGRQRGTPVGVKYSLPIAFKVE
ncbi:energy transducer TonB [Lutibacter flavus]|uniref:Outer membrane transport energization protein TonB (TC 2.C.1.1.1) n=1 Tax=Lutibacter flavus TaxID=691689 RepID=A0A238XBF4_9FLAO|nr:energy transducer TonB [Lutibacter flavus]SNR56287.1 outer membrane transport energization protein TonB (TC 2.C.1.1.1) [Lutibacter flavus]